MRSWMLGLILLLAAACTGQVDDPGSDGSLDADGSGAADADDGDAGPGDPGPGDPGPGDPGPGDPGPGDPGPADADPQPQDICAERSAAIAAATGDTIEVAPGPPGQVLVGGQTRSLRQVVMDAQPGDTILLADGSYTFRESSGDNDYTGLYFTTADVTLRGASGDAAAVVLDSAYADHGGQSGVITVAAPGIVLADFTVQRSIFHLIHIQSDGDDVVVHQVHLVDGGQQLLKASGSQIDGVEVGCGRFAMTAAGRDNIWGYGPVDGGTRCYTGGIDTHDARDWWIHDNRFSGIYCTAGGVQRPAHGKKAELRDGQTYTGGLAEHAVHMWDAVDGHGHLIERNRIVNCARGIGLGMTAEVHDSIIRNNTVFSEHAGGGEHDVGIILERAHDCLLANNTVLLSSPQAYANAIEYRWASTSALALHNNLTNRRIRARDGAQADSSHNLDAAQAAWFSDPAAGDLHLADCDLQAVVGAGTPLAEVPDDLDQQPRHQRNDIGADQCGE